MKKNLGPKPYMYPMPVLIVGSYDENGVPDAMNAAWGIICDMDKISLYLDKGHKTVKNILQRGAFTVSIADAANVAAADYVGVVSANDVPDKVAKAGWTASESEFVDAPVFDELPMVLECTLISFHEDSECLVGQIINLAADEKILGENGKIDLSKFSPIVYDPVHNDYLRLGEKVGNAFSDGMMLK